MRRLFQRCGHGFLLMAFLTGLWGCANLPAILPAPPAFLTPIHPEGPYDADIPARDFRQIKYASLMQDQAVPYLFLRVAGHFEAAEDPQRSLYFFNRAIQEFRKRDNTSGEGSAWSRKISALIHFGRLDEACRELDERGRMHPEGPLRAFIYYNDGFYHLKSGHYAEAQKLFAQAISAGPPDSDNADWLALRRDAGLASSLAVILGDYFPFMADQLSTLNFDYVSFPAIRQNMAAAATHLEEVLALNRRIRSTDVYRYYPEMVSPFADCDTYNLLGLAYAIAGNMPLAGKHLQRAAGLSEKMNYPLGKADNRFFSGQISLFHQERIPDSRDVQALSDLAGKYQFISYSIWANLMSAYAYRQAGDVVNTTEALNGALALLEENASWLSREDGFRGIRLFRRRVLYETLISLYTAGNNKAGAFQTAERMKGAFLAESAADERIAKTDELLEFLRQLRECRGQLAENYRKLVKPAREAMLVEVVEKIRAGRKACGELMTAIKMKDEALHALIDVTRPQAQEVQRLLDSNTTLFTYYAGEKSLYIWVITQKTIHQEIIKLSRRDVDRLLTSWIDAMKYRDRDAIDTMSEKVYDLFLKPVIPFVHGDRIGFVPDVSLYHLPFAALRYVQSYLVDGFSIFQVPHLGMLKSLLAHSSTLDTKKAIFIDDAACLEKQYLVKRTAEERNILKRMLPNAQGFVLNGAGANDLPQISGNYGMILARLHDACIRRLSFAPGGTMANQYGSRAGDVIRLKISGQLTLYGACHPRSDRAMEKGLTTPMAEWLYGISPRIIIQLWDVDEKAQRAFWKIFLESLKKSDGVADALRVAQSGMIQNGYGPSDWAAFVLTGRY